MRRTGTYIEQLIVAGLCLELFGGLDGGFEVGGRHVGCWWVVGWLSMRNEDGKYGQEKWSFDRNTGSESWLGWIR